MSRQGCRNRAVKIFKRSIIVIFCLVLLSFPLNYYMKLTTADSKLRSECKAQAMNVTDEDIKIFCAQFSTWRICAIFGIVISCLLIILALIQPETGPGQRVCQSSTPDYCWTCSTMIVAGFTVAVLVVLIYTDAHTTVVEAAPKMSWAADAYIGMLGILVAITVSLSCCSICTAIGVCSGQWIKDQLFPAICRKMEEEESSMQYLNLKHRSDGEGETPF